MMGRCVLVLTCVALFHAPRPAAAHEVRPGYLEIRQRSADTYDVLWKVPALGELRLRLEARFPEECVVTAPRITTKSGDSFLHRWSIQCPDGLVGRSIAIDGLADTMTDVLVRFERTDGTTQVTRLRPAAPAFTVTASPNLFQVATTYTILGIEHILLGIDHLLFVLALLFVVRGAWPLIKTVTAFTVAHSITLGLAALGLVHVPGPPVEAVIALSIVFVAKEIVSIEAGHPGLTQRQPWIIAFSFGLLHGFGFAGALADIGLPQRDIPVALLSFNIGVELGQLAFVFVILGLVGLVRLFMIESRPWMRTVPVYGIGIVATYWTIERVLAVLA